MRHRATQLILPFEPALPGRQLILAPRLWPTMTLVVSALMPHAMDFGRIGENAVGLVAQHGTVLPARLPQLVDDRHVFVGSVVPQVVVGLGGQPQAARRAVEIAGHDVPADPAVGQVVKRRRRRANR